MIRVWSNFVQVIIQTSIQSHHTFAGYTKGSLYERVWSKFNKIIFCCNPPILGPIVNSTTKVM